MTTTVSENPKAFDLVRRAAVRLGIFSRVDI